MVGATAGAMVVRQTPNPGVAGSNPAAGKHSYEGLAKLEPHP